MRYLATFLMYSYVLLGCKDDKVIEQKIVQDLTQYVDPQIGSVHGRWFFYTPAARPFGMAKLAPHTNAYNSRVVGGQRATMIAIPPSRDSVIFMNFKLVDWCLCQRWDH